MFESSYVNVVLIIVEISKLLYTDCYSYKKIGSSLDGLIFVIEVVLIEVASPIWHDAAGSKDQIDVHFDAYMRRSLNPVMPSIFMILLFMTLVIPGTIFPKY